VKGMVNKKKRRGADLGNVLEGPLMGGRGGCITCNPGYLGSGDKQIMIRGLRPARAKLA
jgi:hypothetical protein